MIILKKELEIEYEYNDCMNKNTYYLDKLISFSYQR